MTEIFAPCGTSAIGVWLAGHSDWLMLAERLRGNNSKEISVALRCADVQQARL